MKHANCFCFHCSSSEAAWQHRGTLREIWYQIKSKLKTIKIVSRLTLCHFHFSVVFLFFLSFHAKSMRAKVTLKIRLGSRMGSVGDGSSSTCCSSCYLVAHKTCKHRTDCASVESTVALSFSLSVSLSGFCGRQNAKIFSIRLYYFLGPSLLHGMCRNEAKACSILLVDKRFTAPKYRRFLTELKSITIWNWRPVWSQVITYGWHIFNNFVSMTCEFFSLDSKWIFYIKKWINA